MGRGSEKSRASECRAIERWLDRESFVSVGWCGRFAQDLVVHLTVRLLIVLNVKVSRWLGSSIRWGAFEPRYYESWLM